MMKDSKAAFEWIVGLLRELNQPFVVVGGLAVNVYGGTRPLNDIDLDVPGRALTMLLPQVREHVTFGPARYQDLEFDIELMTLRYAGQEIDLTAAESIRLYDHRTGSWRYVPTSDTEIEEHIVLGMKVPVMRKELLVAYKQMIQRDTDLEDIRQMGG